MVVEVHYSLSATGKVHFERKTVSFPSTSGGNLLVFLPLPQRATTRITCSTPFTLPFTQPNYRTVNDTESLCVRFLFCRTHFYRIHGLPHCRCRTNVNSLIFSVESDIFAVTVTVAVAVTVAVTG